MIIDQGAKVFEGTLQDARTSVSLSENDSLEEIFFAATGDRSGRDVPSLESDRVEPVGDEIDPA